jgi:hypothetical protein
MRVWRTFGDDFELSWVTGAEPRAGTREEPGQASEAVWFTSESTAGQLLDAVTGESILRPG